LELLPSQGLKNSDVIERAPMSSSS